MEPAAKSQASLKKRVPPLSSFVLKHLNKYDYVDKSLLLASLMAHKETFLFVPSMRRCGKTVTLMLLQAMAEGNKTALSGLKICTDPSRDWEIPTAETYTVIKLDFSSIAPGGGAGALARYFRERAVFRGVTVPEPYNDPSEILRYWIESAATKNNEVGQRVVLLIDEYDSLLTPFLSDPPRLESISTEILKPVFAMLKGQSDCLFKVVVTGGLKAGMSGLFSGANNFYRLIDQEPRFAQLFGFTDEEIQNTYGEHIKEIFQPNPLDKSMEEMAAFYNGYRFHPESTETYFNPWSIISYLNVAKLDRYWAHTCASGGLLDRLLLRHGADALAGCQTSWDMLQQPLRSDGYTENWVSLFFQSGYLTISVSDEAKASDKADKGDSVFLLPPNQEVRQYLKVEIPRLLEIEAKQTGQWPDLVDYSSLMSKFEFDEAAGVLTRVLNGIKYDLLNENEFGGWALHSLRFHGSSFEYVVTELSQRIPSDKAGKNAKRLDGALVVNQEGTYSAIIVELKFNKDADEALNQIKDRDYVARCQDFLQQRLDIQVTNWYAAGFNLSPTPTKLVTCKHELLAATIP